MRLRPLAFAFGAAIAVSPAAWAQMPISTSAGPSLEALASGAGRGGGLASGLKLGDEAILHAGVFADVGYDSNVFYSPNTLRTASVLHVIPKLEITNAERDGSIPTGTHYVVSGSLDWRKYLTSDTTITQQDAFNPSIGAAADFSSGQAISFALGDSFTRYQQAPYTSGEPITRDDNLAAGTLKLSPGGGRLKVNLRYSNLIDYYEGTYNSGSNMDNELMVDAGWRWLPKTTIYVQVGQGVITYFNSGSTGSASYPLRTLVGLRGLLTEKLSVNVAAGYSNAFYSSTTYAAGFGNVGLVAEANYAASVLSRVGLGYRHDFANSPFVGQYYNLDAIYAAFQQTVALRVAINLFGRYEHRSFGANANRSDNYLMGGVAIDYTIVGNYLLAGASYSLNLNRTNQAGGATGGIDYTKQVLLFRLGLVY